MSWYYAHTLIATEPDFAPRPQQVAAFVNDLKASGGEPISATYRLGTLTGEVREGRHPLTGETISVPRRSFLPLPHPADIDERLKGVEDYNLLIEGHGPCQLPPFKLYTASSDGGTANAVPFEDSYDYEIQLCLRQEPVSTSDWHEEISPEPLAPRFGQPGHGEKRRGYFHHPQTGAVITVEDAGCARFWLQFQCGKFLYPKIEGTNLNVLEPQTLKIATQSFGVGFSQGCVFG